MRAPAVTKANELRRWRGRRRPGAACRALCDVVDVRPGMPVPRRVAPRLQFEEAQGPAVPAFFSSHEQALDDARDASPLSGCPRPRLRDDHARAPVKWFTLRRDGSAATSRTYTIKQISSATTTRSRPWISPCREHRRRRVSRRPPSTRPPPSSDAHRDVEQVALDQDWRRADGDADPFRTPCSSAQGCRNYYKELSRPCDLARRMVAARPARGSPPHTGPGRRQRDRRRR